MGLRVDAGSDVWSTGENLWHALTLARNVRLQGEADARERASGKTPPVRAYNVDSEDFQGG